MDFIERFKRFTTADFICSYFAKFSAGFGLGLLVGGQGVWGWFLIFLAVVIGVQAEIKFWRN